MAGGDKEEFPPLLPPGLHAHDLDALRRLCVLRFPESFTRPNIMTRLEGVISLIQQSAMTCCLWIDGSFLTEKFNPDDVDVALVLTPRQLFSLSLEQRNFFDWFRSNSLYRDYRCDNYGVVLGDGVVEAEYQYAYWLRQFGFSRGNVMKGLAVVNMPFVVMP